MKPHVASLRVVSNRVIHLCIDHPRRSVEFTARSGKKYSLPVITRSSACRIAQLTYTNLVTCSVGMGYACTWLHIRPV